MTDKQPIKQPVEQTEEQKMLQIVVSQFLENVSKPTPKIFNSTIMESLAIKTEMKNILEISTLQHQIDLKNKNIELKVYNLFEKVIDVMDRNMPTNKDEDKRFINLMEKITDILHTNKTKQLDKEE